MEATGLRLEFEGEGTDNHAVLAPPESYAGRYFTVIVHGGNEDEIAQRIATAVNERSALLKVEEALRAMLGGDEKMQVSIGGNPNYVDDFLAATRSALSLLEEVRSHGK